MKTGKWNMAAKRDINVTPLIDVMSVILIIFMLATPLTHAGLEVELPITDPDPDTPTHQTETLVLEIDAHGAITINKKPIDKEELLTMVRDILETRADKTIFVSADHALLYRESLQELRARDGPLERQ